MGKEPPRAMVVGYSLNPPAGSPNLIFFQSYKPLLVFTQTGINSMLRPFGIGSISGLFSLGSVASTTVKLNKKTIINFKYINIFLIKNSPLIIFIIKTKTLVILANKTLIYHTDIHSLERSDIVFSALPEHTT